MAARADSTHRARLSGLLRPEPHAGGDRSISTLPPLLGRLFDSGEGRGDPAVAVMFCTVYVVWAIFLFRSARDPSANRLFLDFNLTANAAHFAVMLVMAVTMPDEHQHIAGVIALGVISTVPLAACWLPVRSSNSVRLDDPRRLGDNGPA
jgi:hypothetical protein